MTTKGQIDWISFLPVILVAVCVDTTDAFSGTIIYAHDAAGRLIAADFGGGKTIAYIYDNAGNLTQRAFTAASPDSDGDGMDDLWETSFFGNLARDGTGDFDNDGFRDLHEFRAGTTPNSNNSLLRFINTTVAAGTSTTIEWQAVAGKTYRVQFKNALSDALWTDLPGDVTATATTASKVDNTVGNQPVRFYRIVLVP